MTDTEASVKPHDGWPAVARLITLAFHDDAHIAQLAAQVLRPSGRRQRRFQPL